MSDDIQANNEAVQDERSESAEVKELYAALAKAQGAFENASKDAENPHFRSKYADLASVWDACRKPLSMNGLAVLQRPTTSPEGLWLETRLCHSSGQWLADRSWWPVAQRTPQAYGSALTYARRYTLSALLGIASEEDDDGNQASHPAGRPSNSRPPPTSAPPKPPPQKAKETPPTPSDGEPSGDEMLLATLREHLQAATTKAEANALMPRITAASAWVKDQIRGEFGSRLKDLP